MTSRRTFIWSALTLAAIPLLCSWQAGCAAEKTAKNETPAARSPALSATGGATVVASAEKLSTIKIKCGKCGFQTAAIEIDTPTAGTPYTVAWKCPKCGLKHSVTVARATA